MRVLSLVPGCEENKKSMPFVRRQIDSVHAAGIETRSFYLRSRTSPFVLLKEFKRFRKVLRQFDPHLVHAQFGTVTGLFSAIATGRTTVMSCRGSDINPAPGVNHLRNRMGHLMSQLALLRMSRIVCVSQQLHDRLWWRKSRSDVIPDAVDFKVFYPMPRETAREKLSWDSSDPVVLFNARSDPVGKRLDLAVATIAKAREQLPNIKLHVLRGDVPPPKMPLYYNAADCLLLTSDHEGSPNVVKEALACDLPVVSVDVGDVRERIRGVIPSTIAERDPDSLSQALIRVMEMRRRSNGRSAVGDVEDDVITQRVISIYWQALGQTA